MAKNYKKGSKHATERVEDSGLTIVQEQVAVYLAMGMAVSDISTACDVPASTIYSWRKLPEFASHFKRLQLENVRKIRGRMSQKIDSAIDTIIEIAEGGGEQNRLKAACYMLDFIAGDYREAKRLKLKAQTALSNAKK